MHSVSINLQPFYLGGIPCLTSNSIELATLLGIGSPVLTTYKVLSNYAALLPQGVAAWRRHRGQLRNHRVY